MDRNRIEGSKHEAKGTVKETFGKMAANSSQRPEDRIGKNADPARKDAGKPAEQVRREQPHH